MKHKNTIIAVCLALILVTLVTAQLLNIRNTTVEVTKENKTTLELYNITSPETSELKCFDGLCEYKMFQIMVDEEGEEYKYNLGTHELKCKGLTTIQCGEKQELQYQEWLGEYAQVLKDREEQPQKETILNKTQINIIEVGK